MTVSKSNPNFRSTRSMTSRVPSDAPLAFPFHLGPGIRGLASPLLFHGGLKVDLPGWVSPDVTNTFNAVFQRALETSHELLPLFRAAVHYYGLSQTHAQGMDQAIEPLRDRTQLILTLYPGNTDAYSRWEPLHEACLPVAHAALSDPFHCCVASLELVWRLHELALESNADVNRLTIGDAQHLLHVLAQRANKLGGWPMLLAECALNRYCMPRSGAGSYATDSPLAVALLAALGVDLGVKDAQIAREPCQEAIAFYFFDQVLPPQIRKLTEESSAKIAKLFDARTDELMSLRKKCRDLALELETSEPSHKAFSALVRARLDQVQGEISDMVELDGNTVRSYLRQLAEDQKTWLAVSGLLGSVVGVPDVVTAGFAITTLSTLGAQAVKTSNLRRDKLKSSPWAFLYYAAR